MNDECSAIFLRKLDGFVGQNIDLGKWLHASLSPIPYPNVRI